jgi:predicted lipase
VTKATRVSDYINGIFGYVAYNSLDDQVVVTFRGSDNIANWISNIDFVQTTYKNVTDAKVHRGFYGSYEIVQPQLISAVKQLLASHPSASILVAGHSLGAALATFAAVDIKETLNPKTNFKLYNFGSPRTGNQAFTDHVMRLFPEGTFYRVVHSNDIVPHLPVTGMGFNHAGTEVWYPATGTELGHQICQNSIGAPENPTCADTVPVWNYSNACHLIYVGIDFNTGWCSSDAYPFLA